MTELDYFIEALQSSMQEHGVVASDSQISAVAKDIIVSIECKSQAFYTPENPIIQRNEVLTRQLRAEKGAVFCKECQGKGVIYEYFGQIGRGSSMQCHKCNGIGKIYSNP